MRVVAIGDIHGCLRALDLVLEMVRPGPDDLVVTLGDHIDRGPDSCGVLDRLLELGRRCRLVSLRGNHELMLLAARREPGHLPFWLSSGGREALASYVPAGREATLDDIPDRHWRFMDEACRPFYEIDTHFFVHANAYPEVPLDEQPDYMLYWEKLDPGWTTPHASGKVMVCGHTPQRTGRPLDLGHAVCIDTWVYGRGWLTALDVKTGRLWQATQAGATRTGWLGDELPPPDET